MVKSEDRMIGYCGYNCYLCAARSDDINVRRKLVDAWRKYLGHQHYTAENVACEGCKSKVIRSRIRNAKLDLAHERKA